MDSQKRTIVKSLSWRVWASIITICIAYFVTGEMAVSLSIGLADTLFKLLAYYFHERTWNKIRYGIIESNYGQSGGGI